jgi:membrane protease YdiL (CAAX protease family)
MARASQRNIVEVVLVVIVIATFLWFGRRSFPGANAVFAVLLLAILVHSHRKDGEGFREIGFRGDTFAATSRLLLPLMLIGGALIIAAALALDGMQFPPWQTTLRKTAAFVALGIVQQYLLVGFFFRRLERITTPRLAPVLTASIFALLHLPNVFLMVTTFVAGIVACLVYRRSPNLWANGLAHGLMTVLLYYALPRSLTGGLRVGAAYAAALTS